MLITHFFKLAFSFKRLTVMRRCETQVQFLKVSRQQLPFFEDLPKITNILNITYSSVTLPASTLKYTK